MNRDQRTTVRQFRVANSSSNSKSVCVDACACESLGITSPGEGLERTRDLARSDAKHPSVSTWAYEKGVHVGAIDDEVDARDAIEAAAGDIERE